MTVKQALRAVANGEETTGNYLVFIITKGAYIDVGSDSQNWYHYEIYEPCMDIDISVNGSPSDQTA